MTNQEKPLRRCYYDWRSKPILRKAMQDEPMVTKDEDKDLFRAEMQGVRPVRPTNRATLDKPRPSPLPVKRMEDDKKVVSELLSDHAGWDDFNETGNAETYLRAGLPREVLRRLKRGDWVIQSEMDLHGLNSDAARSQLAGFIQHAKRNGLRCIKVIHGKGLRSQSGEAILRNKVRKNLMLRDEVLAFADARPADGGSGAVVILLKG
jgi:DNA-nicking Smr family endonuclease